MPSAIDLTGQKFGRLTAISYDLSSGKRLWRFLCDCGKEKIANAAFVKYGTIQSCGCLRRETTKGRKFLDVTGQRFSRLVVENELPERSKRGLVMWSCKCDCGNVATASTTALKNGIKRSCGCLNKEMMSRLGASSKQLNPISRTKEYRSQLRSRLRENPVIAMAERVSSGISKALLSVGASKTAPTFSLLGFTPEQLKEHIEKQFLPKMTWKNRSEWQIDHITPISSAKSESDVIALNQLFNLRPIWSSENNLKRAKIYFLI